MLFDVVLTSLDFIIIVLLSFIAGIAVSFIMVSWLGSRIEEKERIKAWHSERNSE